MAIETVNKNGYLKDNDGNNCSFKTLADSIVVNPATDERLSDVGIRLSNNIDKTLEANANTFRVDSATLDGKTWADIKAYIDQAIYNATHS